MLLVVFTKLLSSVAVTLNITRATFRIPAMPTVRPEHLLTQRQTCMASPTHWQHCLCYVQPHVTIAAGILLGAIVAAVCCCCAGSGVLGVQHPLS